MSDVVQQNGFGDLAEKLHWRICTGDLTECHKAWGPCCRAAQEVLAAGWRKVNPDAETWTETQWGFKLPDRDAIWALSEESARARAAQFPNGEVVTRTVTTTAWTTPEETP